MSLPRARSSSPLSPLTRRPPLQQLLLLLLAAPALALTSACNTLIGMEDVELADEEPPPPPPPTCNVAERFGLIASNPETTSLIHRGGTSTGGASLLFLLNTDARPDSFVMQLYDNMGGHGVLNAVGNYTVTAADAKLETCGICLLVNTDFDSSGAGSFRETFMAQAQGTLSLTTATTTRLAGRIQRLKLRRVDNSGGVTREVADPCSVTIDDVVFDMPYSTSAAISAVKQEGV